MARPGRFVGLSTGALRQCAMCWSAIRNGTRNLYQSQVLGPEAATWACLSFLR